MRVRQRNRNKPKEAYWDNLMKWHRDRFICTGGNSDSYDPKWGSFLPPQRFNLDQSPIPFVIDLKRRTRLMKLEIVIKRHGLVSYRQAWKGNLLCRYVLVEMARNQILP